LCSSFQTPFPLPFLRKKGASLFSPRWNSFFFLFLTPSPPPLSSLLFFFFFLANVDFFSFSDQQGTTSLFSPTFLFPPLAPTLPTPPLWAPQRFVFWTKERKGFFFFRVPPPFLFYFLFFSPRPDPTFFSAFCGRM